MSWILFVALGCSDYEFHGGEDANQADTPETHLGTGAGADGGGDDGGADDTATNQNPGDDTGGGATGGDDGGGEAGTRPIGDGGSVGGPSGVGNIGDPGGTGGTDGTGDDGSGSVGTLPVGDGSGVPGGGPGGVGNVGGSDGTGGGDDTGIGLGDDTGIGVGGDTGDGSIAGPDDPDFDEDVFCAAASKDPTLLDDLEVWGDDHVMFCHSGGCSNYTFVDSNIDSCLPHLDHKCDVFSRAYGCGT